jgi:hypothetical protein
MPRVGRRLSVQEARRLPASVNPLKTTVIAKPEQTGG